MVAVVAGKQAITRFCIIFKRSHGINGKCEEYSGWLCIKVQKTARWQMTGKNPDKTTTLVTSRTKIKRQSNCLGRKMWTILMKHYENNISLHVTRRVLNYGQKHMILRKRDPLKENLKRSDHWVVHLFFKSPKSFKKFEQHQDFVNTSLS